MTTETYIKRTIEPVIRQAVKEFPAIFLTGPRQSGKTTLLKKLFGTSHLYVSLEPPDIQAAAKEDPRGFLKMYPPPVIFDEVQHAPELLIYIKEIIDADRNTFGKFLLTGSQNLLLTQKVTESLAGRTAMLRLLPLSFSEISREPDRPMPWEGQEIKTGHNLAPMEIWGFFLKGCYPEIISHPERDSSMWHSSYIQTYLERDVRSIRQVGDLTQFQIFLRALAARSAQLLSLSELSRDMGVAVNTIKAWLSVLEATYQIIILRPYFANIGKRLVKTPKIYFTDTGTLCYLTGLKDPEHLAYGPMGGAVMETAVLGEIYKRLTHRGVEPRIYFWRTATGTEVDLIIDMSGKLIPVEVKHSSTPTPAMSSGIRKFCDDLKKSTSTGYLIHTGSHQLPLGSGVKAVPFFEL
jgi:predicted AAA+ superfamily ATPase